MELANQNSGNSANDEGKRYSAQAAFVNYYLSIKKCSSLMFSSLILYAHEIARSVCVEFFYLTSIDTLERC